MQSPRYKLAAFAGAAGRLTPMKALAKNIADLHSGIKNRVLDARDPRLRSGFMSFRQPMIHGHEVAQSPAGFSALAEIIGTGLLGQGRGRKLNNSGKLRDLLGLLGRDMDPHGKYVHLPKIGLKAEIDPAGGLAHLHKSNPKRIDPSMRQDAQGMMRELLQDPEALGLGKLNYGAFDTQAVKAFAGLSPQFQRAMASTGNRAPDLNNRWQIGNPNYLDILRARAPGISRILGVL